MDEIMIDTVAAYTLEQGDRVQYMDPDTGEYILDTIKDVEDDGDTCKVLFEDRDEYLSYDSDQRFDLYGYESVVV